MKIVLLDYGTLGPEIDLTPLRQAGELVAYEMTAQEGIAERLGDADVVITNKLKLNRQSLAGARQLKLICVTATGFDNVEIPYCQERGIAVCNVPGYSTDSVAQLTVAVVLALSNKLMTYRDHVHSGFYARNGMPNILTPVWHELAGKTWGIVGFGSIGKKVSDIAKAFGCMVIACKRTPVPDIECTDIDTLCRKADIISLHTPLNDGTRGMIGEKQLALMKKDAILINVARGAVLDEAAVAKAILEKRIGGFGCDVYSVEPFPTSHPYNEISCLPNVCMTPHIAWGAYETRLRLIGEMIKNISAFRDGEIRNRVDI